MFCGTGRLWLSLLAFVNFPVWFRVLLCWFRLFRRLASSVGLILICHRATSATDFSNCFPFSTLGLFLLFLFWFFLLLLRRAALRLDIVNQIIKIFFIDLLVYVSRLWFNLLSLKSLLIFFSTWFSLTRFSLSQMVKQMLTCNTSTHAAAISSPFFMRLKLLTVIIIIVTNCMSNKLCFLLLLVRLLLEYAALHLLRISSLLLLFTFALLLSFSLILNLGVSIQVDF